MPDVFDSDDSLSTCPSPARQGLEGGFLASAELQGSKLARLTNARYRLSFSRHQSMLEWLGGSYDPDGFLAGTVKFDDPRARWRIAFLDCN